MEKRKKLDLLQANSSTGSIRFNLLFGEGEKDIRNKERICFYCRPSSAKSFLLSTTCGRQSTGRINGSSNHDERNCGQDLHSSVLSTTLTTATTASIRLRNSNRNNNNENKQPHKKLGASWANYSGYNCTKRAPEFKLHKLFLSALVACATLQILQSCPSLVAMAADGSPAKSGEGSTSAAKTETNPIETKIGEILQVAETATQQATAADGDRYAPPVNPAESSSKTQVESSTEQQQIVQQITEEVPSVAGQDEVTSSQPEISITTTGALEVDNTSQQQDQQPADVVDQQLLVVGALPTVEETDSIRLGATKGSENDVEPQRKKTVDAQTQEVKGFNQGKKETSGSSVVKGNARSLKRAFAGHIGVFGRKRNQNFNSNKEEQQSVVNEQTQTRNNKYHYYYQSTSSTTKAPTAKTKLRNADYPDYREILVQPDSEGEKLQQQEFDTQRMQEFNQQRVEQASVGETDLNEQSGLPVEQQQQQAEEQTETTNQEAAPTTTTYSPYIRLSNIATINSSSSSSNSSSGSGEMKLMRIYVIDLDQKLVVGGSGGGNVNEEQTLTTKKLVDDTIGSTTLTDHYSKSTGAQSTYSIASTTQMPLTLTSEQMSAFSSSNPEQVAVNYANSPVEMSPPPHPTYLPEGYVMLDKNSLQANISHMLAHMGQYEMAPISRANYSIPGQPIYLVRANYSHPDSYQQVYASSDQQPQPYETSGYEANIVMANHTASAQVSEQHASMNHSAPLGKAIHYSTSGAEHDSSYPGGQIAAIYPQQQQQQVYQSVPQYIAPQYNSASAQPGNPDGYEWQQQQQQQGQVRYKHSNYTSKPTLDLPVAVQAAPMRQLEDKHHANGSVAHLNVYHQEAAMYQQQQQQQQLSEPAQTHQQQANYYNNNEPTYKVTTLPTSGQHWKPVDYSAPPPVAYSPLASGQQQQKALLPSFSFASSISPAHYTPDNNSKGPINGYRDHDVVSLAKKQQQQHQSVVGRYPLEQPGQLQQQQWFSGDQRQWQQAANYSVDGQHAPLNYQPNRAQTGGVLEDASKHLYVNSQPSNSTIVNSGEQATGSGPGGVYNSASFPANDAPSQQVPLLLQTHPNLGSSHPSLGADYRYNGTSDQQAADGYSALFSSSADNANAYQVANNANTSQAQLYSAQGSKTNELLGKYANYQGYGQLEQYGTNSLSVQGNQNQNRHQQLLKSTDQSYQPDEGPQIPLAHSSGSSFAETGHSYRPAAYKTSGQQVPLRATSGSSSPYLSVSGPPIADGVYESAEHEALAHATTGKGRKKPARQAANKVGGYRGRQQNRYKQEAELMGGNEYNSQPVESSGNYEPMNEEQNEPQEAYRPQYSIRPPYSSMNSQRVPNNHHNRPMQATSGKGLLSWETISSVASGAAKRLPSLSSILSPFSGPTTSIKTSYPTSNYGQQQQQQQQPLYGMPVYPSKSVHYEQDVSSFHRPYPLRYMSQQSYADDSSVGSKLYHSYEPLSSSGSNSEPESSEVGEPETGETEYKRPSSTIEDQSKVSMMKGKHSKTNTSTITETVGDLADIDVTSIRPATVQKKRKQQAKRLPSRVPPTSEDLLSSSPANKGSGHSNHMDLESVSVLSTIEQQLSSGGETTKQIRRRPKKGSSGRMPPLDFAEPTIDNQRQPINIDSLSVEQQRLLLKKQPPSSIYSDSEQSSASFGSLDTHSRPVQRPAASLQIGQFKLTPQTQFVQSIFEPSRQMLGQYFKQYMGQLSQFAGRHSRR